MPSRQIEPSLSDRQTTMQRVFSSLCMILLGVPNVVNATEKPNILYILADDLGFSDLGC